ncbi:hypothetical protein [Halosolutus gelatinilyticus]|nr:hypothetical protein [Halosolutus gelatinilyticus]
MNGRDVDLPVGHVGLSTAPEAHEGWPRVREWLAARREPSSKRATA